MKEHNMMFDLLSSLESLRAIRSRSSGYARLCEHLGCCCIRGRSHRLFCASNRDEGQLDQDIRTLETKSQSIR